MMEKECYACITFCIFDVTLWSYKAIQPTFETTGAVYISAAAVRRHCEAWTPENAGYPGADHFSESA